MEIDVSLMCSPVTWTECTSYVTYHTARVRSLFIHTDTWYAFLVSPMRATWLNQLILLHLVVIVEITCYSAQIMKFLIVQTEQRPWIICCVGGIFRRTFPSVRCEDETKSSAAGKFLWVNCFNREDLRRLLFKRLFVSTNFIASRDRLSGRKNNLRWIFQSLFGSEGAECLSVNI